MLPNLLRARRNASLVSIPDGRVIVIGGYSASASFECMDNVEYLSLNAPQNGWWSIAPLPQPISSSGAVYFHDVLIVAGGMDGRGRPLSTVYALRPPSLPFLNKAGEREITGLGQWTKLSAELPRPCRVNFIYRFGEEVFPFREFDVFHLTSFYLVLQIMDTGMYINIPAMKTGKQRKVK